MQRCLELELLQHKAPPLILRAFLLLSPVSKPTCPISLPCHRSLVLEAPGEGVSFHSEVGFDPANRHGAGGNANEVLLLASDIAAAGWSWELCRHAVCIEAEPGSDALAAFNQRFGVAAGLAPVEPDSLRFGSLACGHTNMGLRAIAAGVASDCPLLSEGGRLSIDKLQKCDKEYAKAVNQGLHWTVLKWTVRRDYPAVLDIIQVGR